MTYENIRRAEFVARPNRFIAHCLLEGQEIVCHVKNTGRCRELLVPGATVYVQHHPQGTRKTRWSLIGVEKGDRLVNMDSQAPNQVAWEALAAGALDGLLGGPVTQLRREVKAGDSRLDLWALAGEKEWFIEVKGVTLEQEGLALFPDAPTLRGCRHLEELAQLRRAGHGALALFVIQMGDIDAFAPHEARDPALAKALRQAQQAGVTVAAYTCHVTRDSLTLATPVAVRL